MITRAAPVPSAVSKVVRSPVVPFQSAAAALLSVVRLVSGVTAPTGPVMRVVPPLLSVRANAPSTLPRLRSPVAVCSVVLARSTRLPALTVPLPSARPMTCPEKPLAPSSAACDTCRVPAPPATPMERVGSSGAIVRTPVPLIELPPVNAFACSVRSVAPLTGPVSVSAEPVRRELPVSCSAPE